MKLRILVCAAMFAGLTAAHAQDDPAKLVAELGLRESGVPLRDTKTWQKPKKVIVLSDGPARTASFQAVALGVEVIGVGSPGAAMAQVREADALVGFCTEALLKAGTKVKWVQAQNAGVDECLPAVRQRPGAILTNMQRVNGANVAEHALALTLALTRQIHTFVASQQQGKWDPRTPQPLLDLDGHTMLVVGLGGIGTEIADRAHAFGMRVIATRNSSREGPPSVSYVGLANELPKLIAEADVVINVTPLTPETTGLFNAAMFARMKPSAYFINVGRGPSVVTDDLAAALKDRKLAGAALDVTDPEPLPKTSPLWSMPNVIITPHVAGNSALRQDRMWLVMRENLRRYVAGESLLSIVDPKRGY